MASSVPRLEAGGRALSSTAAVGVLAAWSTLMWAAYSRQREREKATRKSASMKTKDQPRESSDVDRSKVLLERRVMVDHPLFGWLFENGAVWLMVVLQMKLTGSVRYENVPWQRRFWVTLFGLAARERFQLVLHWVLVHKVYSHIPYFHPADLVNPTEAEADAGKMDAKSLQSEKPPPRTSAGGGHRTILLPGVPAAHGDLSAIVKEWVSASLASHVVLSLLIALVINRKPRLLRGEFSLRRFVWEIDPLQFVAKLAIVRVVVDVMFAAGHWAIHRPAIYHSSLVAHKTHHGHNHPSVVTNQHFSIADLFVEAYLPAIAGLMVLTRGLNIYCNPLEEVCHRPPTHPFTLALDASFCQ
jgi:sterol desaturase/sphingolipid hydroxylase (fatty acid hydroxylase superfamily)